MPIAYNFSDLEDLSTAIGKAHAKAESLKGDIRSSAGQLQADWVGTAGESWSTVQTKWDSACGNLVSALHQLARTVISNSDHMAQTEAANRGLFDGM